MKRKAGLLMTIYIGLVMLSSCHHESHIPEPPEMAERTVVVYMIAENSLSKALQRDSAEMASVATTIPADCNLVVYYDGLTKPTITWMSGKLKTGVLTWKRYNTEINSADSASMHGILREIFTAFPARHYGLVIGSHGDGWLPASSKKLRFGPDNGTNSNRNTGSWMTVSALSGILKHFPKLDYLMFDVCMMQNVENAYELRDVAHYLIGSPAEIPESGAPYDAIMEQLVKGDAVGIAKGYFSRTERSRLGSKGLVLSVADLSQMEMLADQAATLWQPVWHAENDAMMSEIQYYNPYLYASDFTPENYDTESAAYRLLPPDKFLSWKAAQDKVIVWKGASKRWSSAYAGSGYYELTDITYNSAFGMFIPQAKYDIHGRNAQWRETAWGKRMMGKSM